MIEKLDVLSTAGSRPAEMRIRQSEETWFGTFQRNRPPFGAAAALSRQVLPLSDVYSIFTVPFLGNAAGAHAMWCWLLTLQCSPPRGAIRLGRVFSASAGHAGMTSAP